MQSLTELIEQDITLDFGRAKYLGHDVIIMKKNGYVNMTALCGLYGKFLKSWNENKSSRELICCIEASAGIPAGETTQVVTGGKVTEIRGTYVHPKLAPHIASWISPKVGVIVSDIVNNNIVLEYRRELERQNRKIEDKDNTIADLKKMIERISTQNEEIKEQNNNIEERVVDMQHKLDFTSEQYVVPTKDKSKAEACAILKSTDPGVYYVIRRQIGSMQTQINIKKRAGFSELLYFENPNSVNLLLRLKENYKDKVKVNVNVVRLTTIKEPEFIALVTHINNEKKQVLD